MDVDLRAWGELTIWVAAVVTALGLLTRTKPVRWMFRRLVSDPFTEWFRSTGGAIIEEKVGKEFTSNGGATLRDAIDGLREGQTTWGKWAAEATEGQAAMRSATADLQTGIGITSAQVGAVQSSVVQISASVGTTLADHGQRITAVEGGQVEVLEAIGRLHRCMERRLSGNDQSAADEESAAVEEEVA